MSHTCDAHFKVFVFTADIIQEHFLMLKFVLQ